MKHDLEKILIGMFTQLDDLMAAEGLQAGVVQPWEDGWRTASEPNSFEWWYFDAQFEDGSTLVLAWGTRDFNNLSGPLQPYIQLTITTPDGRKLAEFPLFMPEELQASTERCDVSLGTSWVRGDLHRYELHAEAGGLAADLVFTGVVPPWRVATGKSYFDEAYTRYFGWLPSIPYGTVEGSLTYDGQTHTVEGFGYHDHNWGNAALNSVLDHWYWGRAHAGPFNAIFAETWADADYGGLRLPVLMLAREDKIIIENGLPTRLDLSDFVKHPSGRQYPRKLDFHWESEGGSALLAMRDPVLIEALDLLRDAPAWKKPLMRLRKNPWYFRFRADLELSVDLGDIQATEKGKALYEIMLLR